MPQMAPINWLMLFIFFFIMFYFMINTLYFNFNKKIKLKKSIKISIMNYNKYI